MKRKNLINKLPQPKSDSSPYAMTRPALSLLLYFSSSLVTINNTPNRERNDRKKMMKKKRRRLGRGAEGGV